MTDIVQRLRAMADGPDYLICKQSLREAADEIERLRKQLKEKGDDKQPEGATDSIQGTCTADGPRV